MKKYLKIWWRLMRLSVMCDMAYKWDFLTRFMTGIVWTMADVAMIYLLYSVAGIDEIAGFSWMDMYLVWSFYQLTMSIVFFITPGIVIKTIFKQIHFGGLDFFIIKPVNLFFLLVNQRISLREFAPTFFSAISGIILISIYGGIELNYEQWMMILFVAMLSIALLIVWYWIALFVAFFVEKAGFMVYFIDEISGVGIYPKEIYPNWMQKILLFAFPFLLVVNPIYSVIKNNYGWDSIVNSGLMAIFFVLILMLEWKIGLQRYNSAA